MHIANLKKRNLILLLALFVIVLTVPSIYVMIERTEQTQKQDLSTDISNAVLQNKAGERAVIDMSKITTFSWDKLYIFPPYTPYEKINSILGTEWFGSRRIEGDENIVLFVFTKEGKVVQYLEYLRISSDFSNTGKMEYSFDDALFTINQQGKAVFYQK
jgi:hypothetical protein